MMMQFRLNKNNSIHWLNWDNDFVVFNDASGQTHHLDAPTARVLTWIEDGATQMNLLVENCDAIGSDGDAVRAALPFILDQLAGANLIDMPRE